jgi:hypothetical protein
LIDAIPVTFYDSAIQFTRSLDRRNLVKPNPPRQNASVTEGQRTVGVFLEVVGVVAMCGWILAAVTILFVWCIDWSELGATGLIAYYRSRTNWTEILWLAVLFCTPPCAAALRTFGNLLCGRLQQAGGGSIGWRVLLGICARTLELYGGVLMVGGISAHWVPVPLSFSLTMSGIGLGLTTGAVVCHVLIRRMLRAGTTAG